MTFLERLGDFIWNPWLLGLFLLVGLFYSLRTGFFQVFECGLWLRTTLGSLLRPRRKRQGGGLTQFQALSTALASTIGTGSIAGVATAIFYGGPGAVFWMWVSALLGMMTSCAEKTLAVRYRERARDGGWQGGPMCYMERGVGSRFLAALFSVCCVAASLGGIGRIGRFSEKLVPCMALLFLGGGAVVLFVHASAIPDALSRIVSGAVAPRAAAGGGLGYGVAAAMRYGIARGVFTNEAGMGSSAMAHAASDVEEPAEEGMWGMFEVFVATLLVCSVTALVILTTGVYDEKAALAAIQSGRVSSVMVGAPLSAAAFSTVFGRFGGIFVSLCLLLFAFTSLLGWSYYGERGLEYLTGSDRWRRLYRAVFLLMVVGGSVGELAAVWQLADIFNGLMALPNLCALLLLAPEALHLLNAWEGKQKREKGEKIRPN